MLSIKALWLCTRASGRVTVSTGLRTAGLLAQELVSSLTCEATQLMVRGIKAVGECASGDRELERLWAAAGGCAPEFAQHLPFLSKLQVPMITDHRTTMCVRIDF